MTLKVNTMYKMLKVVNGIEWPKDAGLHDPDVEIRVLDEVGNHKAVPEVYPVDVKLEWRANHLTPLVIIECKEAKRC